MKYTRNGPILTCSDRISMTCYPKAKSIRVCNNQLHHKNLQASKFWHESKNVNQSYATFWVGCKEVHTQGPFASGSLSRSQLCHVLPYTSCLHFIDGFLINGQPSVWEGGLFWMLVPSNGSVADAITHHALKVFRNFGQPSGKSTFQDVSSVLRVPLHIKF